MNLALVLLLALAGAGCSAKEAEKISTMRLHLEVNKQMVRRSQEVPILRQNSIMVNVEDSPFLHEAYVDEVELVETPGGHEIKLTFNQSGNWTLANVTAANYGKRIAISSQFPDLRWLAAPLIRGRISDGILQFAPDADLEETRRIVDGLSLAIEKRHRQNFTD